MDLPLSRRNVARAGAALCVLCALITLPSLLLPGPGGSNVAGLLGAALAAMLLAPLLWLLPWQRWPQRASLVFAVITIGLIALNNYVAGAAPYRLSAFFLVVFVWVGLGQPRGTSLALTPLLAAASLLPVLFRPHPTSAISSIGYVAPLCLLVGETLSWLTAQWRRSQQAVIANEARLQHIVETSPDLIGVLDQRGCYTFANQAHETILGRPPRQLLGASPFAFLHPDELAEVQERFSRRVVCDTAGSAPHSGITVRLRHTDGRYIWIEARTQTVFDPAGQAEGLLIIGRDITARVDLEERLRHQAFHDPLTGLPNRALFMDRLAQALSRGERRGTVTAVLFLDLDRFKLINDSLGHEAGDALLVAVAERLRACLRPADTVARFGGDEFIVLLEEGVSRESIVAVAQRVLAALTQPYDLNGGNGSNGNEVFSGASIGITLSDTASARPDELVREADIALFEAKAAGRGSYVLFDAGMKAASSDRLDLETDLRQALSRGELHVYYQPEVDIDSGLVVGMEALLRWQHPRRGLIGPDRFLALAEETGLILEIGPWVLEQACRDTRRWQEQHLGTRPLVVSVNLSPREFACAALPAEVARILERTRLAPGSLRLEITEAALMQDLELTRRTLHALKELGVWLAIDDFGSGYSSLNHLRHFPVDTIKIDRSLIAGLDGDAGAISIVRAVTALGHALGLDVTAEGIETADQLALMEAVNCDRGQGWFFAPPAPAAELDELLRRDAASRSGMGSFDDLRQQAG
ncbi:MAG TPA: EAL domain-containing protein [Dehalococcoidia bacterium]|nr:EAL domain-containing protein [Dehalococcoidia bacterium]